MHQKLLSVEYTINGKSERFSAHQNKKQQFLHLRHTKNPSLLAERGANTIHILYLRDGLISPVQRST